MESCPQAICCAQTAHVGNMHNKILKDFKSVKFY